MNRLGTAITAFGLVAIALAFGLALGQPAPTANDPVLLTALVQKTFTNALPSCFDPPDCTMTLRRVDAQVRTKDLLIADLYGGRAGREHFAWAFRVPAGAKWLWVVQAEDRFWLRALRAWNKANPGDIQGPILVSALPGRNYCDNVASRALVPLPVADSGALLGPRDGGPAPSIRCNDAAGPWYRLQTRHQGWTATGAEDPDGGGAKPTLKGREPKLEPRVDPKAWETPDAATHRTCSVPVGTPCP